MSTDPDQEWSHLWTQDWRNQSSDSQAHSKFRALKIQAITLCRKTEGFTNDTHIQSQETSPVMQHLFESLHFNAFCRGRVIPVGLSEDIQVLNIRVAWLVQFIQYLWVLVSHLQNRDKNYLLGEEMDEFYFGQAKFEGTVKAEAKWRGGELKSSGNAILLS